MKPPPFEYVAADSVEHAVSLLAARGGEAKLLAGGQSLMPMLNFRLLRPAALVDINRLPGLNGIARQNGHLRIGALTRHHTIETSDLVRETVPLLHTVMPHIAHLAIRNRGTIGGSLAHADPAAELPLIAVLLDAELEVTGPEGARTIAAQDFFVSALTTSLADAEIITAINLPVTPPGSGWGFAEVARRAGDFALAAVAATVGLDGDLVDDVRIAVTGAQDVPLRISAAEQLCRGQALDPDVIAAAAEQACDAVAPMGDVQASSDYRRHLVGVLTKRALTEAWRRATESGS